MSVMIAYDSRIIVQALLEKGLEKSGVSSPHVNKLLFIIGTLHSIGLSCSDDYTGLIKTSQMHRLKVLMFNDYTCIL